VEALLVEDDRITQLLITKVMKSRGYQVTAVASAEEALTILETQWFPLAFMDLGLPGMSGLSLSQKIRELPRGDSIYIIFGTGEEKLKLEAMLAAGADDYIGKPYTLSQIEIRLAVAEKRVREIARRTHLENELIFLARHDPLTRLNNRWQLEELIEAEIGNTATAPGESSLLVLDLDQFKSINDRFGHQVGDNLLTAVADALRASVPEDAELIRFGGDEFVAILPGIPPAVSQEVTDRIANNLSAIEIASGGEKIRPQASMGVTLLRAGVPTQQLIKEADLACYRAKSLGKNRAEVFVDFSGGLIPTKEPGERVASALRQRRTEELELWFQPVCDLQTGVIFFQESLLRFVGSGGQSPIQAELFLSQINDSAHLRSLDRFVSRKICQILSLYPDLIASFNVHAFSISEWSFAEQLLSELDRLKVEGSRLVVEITELQPINDIALAEGIIVRLAERGIRCAIDDMGSGYSSMHVLRHLSVDFVKIDGRVMRKTGRRGMDDCFLRSLQVLAEGLNFGLVGEHIQSPAELATAREHGIQYGQGYYIGRPRREPYRQEEIDPTIFKPPVLRLV
jgi:diguanylate cyclase (GGDEF)-like protein